MPIRGDRGRDGTLPGHLRCRCEAKRAIDGMWLQSDSTGILKRCATARSMISSNGNSAVQLYLNNGQPVSGMADHRQLKIECSFVNDYEYSFKASSKALV